MPNSEFENLNSASDEYKQLHYKLSDAPAAVLDN